VKPLHSLIAGLRAAISIGVLSAFVLLVCIQLNVRAACTSPPQLDVQSWFTGDDTVNAAAPSQSRQLFFEDRVAYQRLIEEVYWRHRIWPKQRPERKPSLGAVMSQATIEKKVQDYLRNSELLEQEWRRPITPEQLQAEMDRMAQHSKQPEVLRELFAALGNDPFLIAECLARPVLSERLVTSFAQEPRRVGLALSEVGATSQTRNLILANTSYTLPAISYATSECTRDTWAHTRSRNAPSPRTFHTAVWTGSEMIVWGGTNERVLNTGGRYNPSTDSWTATGTTDAPDARAVHTAVWTGSEMIVWGGTGRGHSRTFLNTGGRYDPANDTWTPSSLTNAPTARWIHTAVWTGSEMIVWGGTRDGIAFFNTGGRYNPSTDSWTATSTTDAPAPRYAHTVVWTDSEMIVWGGSPLTRTGGRYNPRTDSWTATSTINAPGRRVFHTAVWTGSGMIVWGGTPDEFDQVPLRSGGIYNPDTDSWTTTNTHHAPHARDGHMAVWTGSEMIVWGGLDGGTFFNTGGRYNPSTDRWIATGTINAPEARTSPLAVWTGSEMMVWGGAGDFGVLNTGGRYCGQSVAPTP